jgi:hypothetical protein
LSTGFELLEGARTESKAAPQGTVRRSGQMALNPPAVAMVGEDVTHVQVGFNTASGIVGIRAAANRARGRDRVNPRPAPSGLVWTEACFLR